VGKKVNETLKFASASKAQSTAPTCAPRRDCNA